MHLLLTNGRCITTHFKTDHLKVSLRETKQKLGRATKMSDNKISGFAGERIRYLRKINNLTLENIAKLTGKSKSTISKYERGEISVDLETLYQFSEAFSVPIHHFLYQSLPISSVLPDKPDARFQANKILCIYHWDARPHRNRCLLSVVEMNTSSSQSVLYWDVADYLHYTKCNYIFYGNLLKSEPSRRFILINNVSQMDMLGINYLNPLIFHNMKEFIDKVAQMNRVA